MSVKLDTVTPVVRLQLLLAYWQDIYFGQLTEMALIFSVFINLIWTMTKISPKKKIIIIIQLYNMLFDASINGRTVTSTLT